MTAWYPEVVQIEKLETHPNADNLDIATVLGDHPVIVKRGEYIVGDLCGYIPIDSITPDTEEFYFLCPKQYEQYEEDGEIKQRQVGPKYELGSVPEKYRIIKAKKIRNVFSMGMLVKLDFSKNNLTVGDSIIDLIGLKKWEEEVDDNIITPRLKGKDAASPPQGWSVPYYDIESLRKYSSCIKEDEEVVLLEKINGSNSSFTYDGEKLWVKSRNWYKKPDPDDSWVEAGTRYDLENKLKDYPMFAFYCELTGLVKGFRYDLKVENGRALPKLFFFDIYDLNNNRFLDYDDFIKIIDGLGLQRAPELYRGPWLGKEKMFPYAEGLTTLGGKHIREGYVLRTTKERYEPKLNSRLQLKLVGEGYNLSK